MRKLSTIKVSGADAAEFLQGQLTNDLARLDTEAEILAAWCNPKGRVIWFGTILKTDSGFAMSAPAETAEDIVKRLTVFRFRAKVDFEVDAGSDTVDAGFLIDNGYPFIGPQQVEQFTPHMLNLDLLNAISLTKGCYTGQEIVARTHYKGATKRRTLRFASQQPVSEGDAVLHEAREIGKVFNCNGTDLLAVVPVAQADATLQVGGITISRMDLPYEVLTDQGS